MKPYPPHSHPNAPLLPWLILHYQVWSQKMLLYCLMSLTLLGTQGMLYIGQCVFYSHKSFGTLTPWECYQGESLLPRRVITAKNEEDEEDTINLKHDTWGGHIDEELHQYLPKVNLTSRIQSQPPDICNDSPVVKSSLKKYRLIQSLSVIVGRCACNCDFNI